MSELHNLRLEVTFDDDLTSDELEELLSAIYAQLDDFDGVLIRVLDRDPERVQHRLSGKFGVVKDRETRTLETGHPYIGDLAGEWCLVHFDDGLRTWCPASTLT